VHSEPERAAKRAAAYVEQGFHRSKVLPLSLAMGLGALGSGELSLEILRNAETVVKSVQHAVEDKCNILLGTPRADDYP